MGWTVPGVEKNSTRSDLQDTSLGRTFFDTNVLIYAFDDKAPAKQERAQQLLSDIPVDAIVLSGQVLGEFYWAALRKLALTSDQARSVIDWLSSFHIVPVGRNLVRGAIDLSTSARIAYWDALIVKAAATASCHRVLTEDLNHLQVIDGVQVVNPFRDV